jgi:hypothetical protein
MTLPPLVVAPRSATTMAPFFREATVNRETALALLQSLTEEELSRRPDERRWSIGDVCAHLARSNEVYLPALDDAIAGGHASAAYTDRPYTGSLLARILVWMMEPPPRFSMRSPRDLLPPPIWSGVQARDRYLDTQAAFLTRLDRAAGLDLRNVKFKVPEPPRTTVALGTILAFLLAHERRHLWQAMQVRNAS